MGLNRREFTKDFELRVIAEVEGGRPMSQVAPKHHVNANTIAKWRKQL